MGFIITDGVNYITQGSSGSHTVTQLQSGAKVFDNETRANNMMKNLSNEIKKNYPDLKVQNSTIENKAKLEARESKCNDPIYRSLINILKLTSKKQAKLDELKKQHSDYDKMVVDYTHKIELNNLTQKEILELYGDMHNVLVKRREVKNKIYEIGQIMTFIDFDKVNKLLDYYERRDNPVYENRILEGYIGK